MVFNSPECLPERLDREFEFSQCLVQGEDAKREPETFQLIGIIS